jgi:hypothetical protein
LRVVLLGAGASADAGIPTALEMLPKIRASLIKDPMWHFVGSAFDAVLGGLRQKQAIGGAPFPELDVETFFSALVELAERDQALLCTFVANWSSPIEQVERADLERYAANMRFGLERDLNDVVSKIVQRRTTGNSVFTRSLTRFESALTELASVASGDRSRPFRDAADQVLKVLRDLCWVRDAKTGCVFGSSC